MSEIRTQLRTAVISAPDDGCKGLWGEIARHVDLSGFFPLPLLLQTGEVLGASRQNQLVHLVRKVGDTICSIAVKCFYLYLSVLGWKAKGEVAKLLFSEIVLEAGEEKDSPVVHSYRLEILLLLLPSHHLGGKGLDLLFLFTYMESLVKPAASSDRFASFALALLLDFLLVALWLTSIAHLGHHHLLLQPLLLQDLHSPLVLQFRHLHWLALLSLAMICQPLLVPSSLIGQLATLS